MRFIDNLVLELSRLSFDLADGLRQRQIHVRIARIGSQNLISPIDDNLGAVTSTLDLDNYVGLGRFTVKKVGDFFEMILNMRAQSRCDLNMASGKFKVHDFLNYGLTFSRTGNIHLIAIFCNGAARELDALFAQNLSYFVVSKRFFCILILDHFFDPEF